MTLLAALTGCESQETNMIPTSASQVGGDSIVNPILEELFKRHGIATTVDGNWLRAENGLRIAGAVVQEYPSPKGATNLQLDFYLVLPDERLLIESVGGVGVTKDDAVKDGLHNFVANSFHVLLTAFFNAPPDGQVEIETWNIAGVERRVTIGGMGVRTFSDAPFDPPTHWFPIVKRAIEASHLPSGTHWFRCYYAQFDNKPTAIEVLLDNNDWVPIIETMSGVDWPASNDFYSVRVFAVIQDQK